ncbi:MAG: hypothetical protein KIT62_09970 [Cyclobacteriaceae bacterium]|nr:hypothetical protein [Cyclobacteriaceae bacterium]
MMRLLFLSVAFLAFGCTSEKPKEPASLANQNPAEEGFDLAGSDPAALQLADSVMHALGGRGNWDKIRFITWKSQDDQVTYYWDKQEKRARIEDAGDASITLINLTTGEAKAYVNGTDAPDKAAQANAAFSRASYELALPFLTKSKDFSLQYMGEDTLARQRYNSLVISLKDSTAGKYKLFVDKHEKLVRYWSFYPAASTAAAFVLPFDNYQKQGEVLLSGNRSNGTGPKDIKVEAELSDQLFTAF